MWLLGIVFFFELSDINTFSFAAPAIRIAWHLSIATIGVVTSATFFGMFVGAMTGGWFSDLLGRKRALILSTLWYSGFSLLNALVWNSTGLFLTRLLTGVGLSAMTVVGITYVSEMYPAKVRGAYQGWIMMIGLAGIPVTAYVARFCIPIAPWGWRLVFFWGSLGMLFLAFAGRLEESPRWYEKNGRLAEADDVLNRIERRVQAEKGPLPPPMDSVQIPPKGGGLRDACISDVPRPHNPAHCGVERDLARLLRICGVGSHPAGGAWSIAGQFARLVIHDVNWRYTRRLDRRPNLGSMGTKILHHRGRIGDSDLRDDLRTDFQNAHYRRFWIPGFDVHTDVYTFDLFVYA